MFKDKKSNFDNDTGAKTLNGFSQEALDIASGILKAVKGAFDVFTNAVEQSVELRRVLQRLVSPFGGPNPITFVLADVGFPFVPSNAFLPTDLPLPATS